MQDPYVVLGVPSGSDGLTIRRAYQKLARRWHPALHAGDPEAERLFKAASRAYALLTEGRGDPSRESGPKGPSRSPAGARIRRGAVLSGPDLVYRFEELVVELLPDEAPAAIEPDSEGPALDIHSQVELDLAEALHGVVVSLSVQRESLCEGCVGKGCDACGDQGIAVGLERVRVRIPSGVDDGSRVRVRGQGNRFDGRHGDLYLVVRVRPHEHFERHGHDIYSEIPITVAEAAMGAAIRVPTIAGPVDVSIPAGTRSGQRFRLAGKGIEKPDGRRGDHYCRMAIVPPSVDVGDNRRLLQDLDQPDPRADLPSEPL